MTEHSRRGTIRYDIELESKNSNMAFLAGLLIGIVVALVGTAVVRARKHRATPQTASESNATPSAADEPQTPIAKLMALSAALDTVGEASAHPRDIAEHDAFKKAVLLMKGEDFPLVTLTDFALGANWMLSCASLAALSERQDREQPAAKLVAHTPHFRPWAVHYALNYFLTLANRPPIGALVVRAPEWWADNSILPGLFAEHFADREKLGDTPSFGSALIQQPGQAVVNADEVQAFLGKVNHSFASELINQLKQWRVTSIDRTFLQSSGRIWEADLEQSLLIEPAAVHEHLLIATACVESTPPRSLLVIAEQRTGKTAFLKMLGKLLESKGWAIFEASAADLMAGQMYIGQLEERVRRLSSELSANKKIIWYVPDFAQLALSGRHQGQSASLLDQIFPSIASGQIIVFGELTPNSLTKVLQAKPAVRSAMELLRLRSLSDAEVRTLVDAYVPQMESVLETKADEGLSEAAIHLARYYLGATQMPGSVLDLLKLAAQHAAAHESDMVSRDDLLSVLSQLTGMPRSVLDDRQRIDLNEIRRFFTTRIIGQKDAVNTVVDRVAMLKAGLTDPSRPTAVFLLVGPTGTGKTELAKTLAEYLFGSSERLLRLDMSEFQVSDSSFKIVGGPGVDSESLVQRVRKQPFSVILLDEFEKAHQNIWDLFLQVFDDGRLTDASGHTADFRHTIILLTSNLGATAHQSSGLGFSPTSDAFSNQQVLRAVSAAFRPEFVNRLDKVIVFQPLTRDLMRNILAKELSRVLERRGLRHREWAVEWESSALDFLLDKGFSPSMGARPLKRAIDQYLLAPLAATLVEHRFPEGEQFLFVRSDGKAIQVEFVDPDGGEQTNAIDAIPAASPPATAGITIGQIALQPAGTIAERKTVAAELKAIQSKLAAPPWEELRASLHSKMQSGEFWDSPDRQRVLARYALIDRVTAATATAVSLNNRLDRIGATGKSSRELLSRLALQLYVVNHGIEDVLSDAPVEVTLVIQPSHERRADTEANAVWSERLFDMYSRWASKRRMQWSDVELPNTSAKALVVTGFGAVRILSQEVGLHVLEHGKDDNESDRVVARVEAIPTPLGVTELKPSEILARVKNAPTPSIIVRRYRIESSPLIRDARKGWRTGKIDLVLGGDFDLMMG